MKTDREERAFRATYDLLVDPAPPAPSWEDLMDTATRTNESPTDRIPASRRPLLIAAASALLVALVIGGLAVLRPLGGTEDAELIEESPATTTTAPETSTTTAPTETSVATTAAASSPLEWETVVGPSMRFVTVGMSGAAHPTIIGQYDDIDPETGLGRIRFIRCLDQDCAQQPEVTDLAEGILFRQYGLTIVTGPDGFPVVPFTSGEDPTQTYVDPFTGFESMVLTTNEVIYCRNDACSSFDRYEIGSQTAFEALATGGWMYPAAGWTFGSDGLPMFAFKKGEPDDRALHLVACADPGCRDVTSNVIVDAAPAVPGSPVNLGTSIAYPEVQLAYTAATPTSPPGQHAGWDEATYYEEVRVATCADAGCTGGATIRTIGPGSLARRFDGPDGLPRLVVRTAWVETPVSPPEASDVRDVQLTHELVMCLDESCDQFERTALGTTDLSGPFSGYGRWEFGPDGAPIGVSTVEMSEEAMVPGENGMEPGYMSVGKRLVYSRCDDANCTSWTTTELKRWTEEDDPDGWYRWGEGAGVLMKADGLPLVYYDGPDGIHLLHCPDLACTPPSD